MMNRRSSRPSRHAPASARACSAFLALAFVLHAALPWAHAAHSHDHVKIAVCHAAQDDHAHDHSLGDNVLPSAPEEPCCRTCLELLLAKQVIPWQPPALVPLMERSTLPEPQSAESRPLPVERSDVQARGPPARA